MKLPISWLKDYMNTDGIEPKAYEHEMTMSGSKVETIENLSGGMKNIVTGKILSVEKHPDAEKLVVCMVDTGDEEKLQIVTAATNVFVGAVVPVAKHKSVIHGGTKITKGKLRGVLSMGMFCSTDELGITPEGTATGIMILPEDTPVGADVCEVLGLNEDVVEFEITSNRPDCFSIIGLARETAATFDREFKIPDPTVYSTAAEDANDFASVEIEDFDLCPRFLGKVVKNVKIAPSPEWMQRRLNACGIRAINNVVDITNYVMLEYGQPMHAYDLDNIRGKKITVRRGRQGEMLETLDDRPHELNPELIVISDDERAIGVAGVMGGANTEVTENTVNVLFEAAVFKAVTVRRGAKALGMRTDASALFEKGLDVYNLDGAINRACQLLSEMGGGEVLSGTIECCEKLPELRRLPLEADKINSFLGMNIPEAEMVKILEKLEFKVEDGMITVPHFRPDIEMRADVAEEIARIYGYDKIPSALMRGEITGGGKTEKQRLEDKVKDTLTACGLYEIMTYSFIDPAENGLLRIPEGDPKYNFVRIQNPLGEENSVMRTTLLASLMEVLKTNHSKRNPKAAVFELGKVYIPCEGCELPDERLAVSIGMYGSGDFYTLKGILENLFEALGISGVKFKGKTDNPTFHPGQCAEITADGKVLGIAGRIHPAVEKTYKTGSGVFAAELDFEILAELASTERHFAQLPKFPAMTRDIAVVVDEKVNVGEIAEIIEKHRTGLIESYALFDVYRGDQVGENKKSVAYSIVFRAADRTLTDDEVNERMDLIIGELKQTLNAELRL